jgi:hypothetical protein
MSETIDAIQEKLSISNISEQVKEQVSEHISSAVEAAKDSVYSATIGKVGEFMKTTGRELSKTEVGRVAKDNPVPMLLIGLGVGLLAYQSAYGSKTRRSYRYNEYGGEGEIYRGRQDYQDYDETEFFGGRTQSNRSPLRAAKGKLGNVAGSVSGAAGNAYQSVSGAASGALDTVGGAAVGLSIPSTRYEGQLIGETRDQLLSKAQDAAGDLINRVKEVAGEAQRTLTDEVKNAAGEVQKTVTEQAQAQGLTGGDKPAGNQGNNPTAKSPGISPNPIPGTNPKI